MDDWTRMLEVAVEMRALSGGELWGRIEEALWRRRQIEHAAWAAHGQWWRKTQAGKQIIREAARARTKRMRSVVAAVAKCKGCGRLFERTAHDVERKRGRVCSTACRGRARSNVQLVTIGRESLPLARWAERYGVALNTVCARLKRGWEISRALTTPLRGQS